jgi:2-methylcitrate dehydratase PrpD
MYPKAYPSTLIAELNDGRMFTAHVDYPKGDPENPATKEEIVEKFHLLTQDLFDQKKRNAILEAVNRLDTMPDISELADLVRG